MEGKPSPPRGPPPPSARAGIPSSSGAQAPASPDKRPPGPPRSPPPQSPPKAPPPQGPPPRGPTPAPPPRGPPPTPKPNTLQQPIARPSPPSSPPARPPPGVPPNKPPPSTPPPKPSSPPRPTHGPSTPTPTQVPEKQEEQNKDESPPAEQPLTPSKGAGRRPPPGPPPEDRLRQLEHASKEQQQQQQQQEVETMSVTRPLPPEHPPAEPQKSDENATTGDVDAEPDSIDSEAKEPAEMAPLNDTEPPAQEDVPGSGPSTDGVHSSDEDEDGDNSDDDEDGEGEGDMIQAAKAEEKTMQKLRGILKPGRLSIKCISAEGLKRKGTIVKRDRLDVYFKFTLSAKEGAPSHQTHVHENCDERISLNGEVISFDMLEGEVEKWVVSGELDLLIELWTHNAWNDDLIGQLRISGLRFMQPDQSGIPVSGSFDLFYPVNPAAEKPGPPRPSGASAKLEIVFEEAKVGMTVFTIYEAHNLVPEAGSAGRLKPYVTFQIGEGYHKKSATGSADGNSAFWGEDQVNMWIDRSNWVSNVALQCLSEDVGTDGVVGSAVRSLLPPMRVLPHKAQQSAVLLERDGEQVGELLMRQLFLPAGVLTIQCKGGRGLRGAKAAASAVISSAMSLINPYVVFKADSQATISTRQTKVARDANQDPVWSDTLTMDIVDQYSLQVDCFDHDLVAEDALIGSAKVSLLPVFKKGRFDGWVEISAMMSYGAPRPAGELHLVLEFKGPHGIAYPQNRSGVDKFDDSEHEGLRDHLREVPEGEKQTPSTSLVVVPDQDTEESAPQPAPLAEKQPTEEFTEEEILSAFRFLDLDNNNFVGASEIRHILICMGELITDEEVDVMIDMVDRDGDGQISFQEFRALVLDPDPARDDFRVSGTGETEQQEVQDRKKEAEDRNAKKLLLEDFVHENELGSAELGLITERYHRLAPSSDMLITFEQWVEVLDVEATGQYRKLFKLYVASPPGHLPEKLDMKEFLLGISNFVEGLSHEQKARFIFDLYDDDRSGFLSIAELVEVLKANHMQSAKAVLKKAQTIMKQVDADDSGTLSLEEFQVMAKKFPNLLFPKHQKEGQDKNASSNTPRE